jgi:hypothetical protein
MRKSIFSPDPSPETKAKLITVYHPPEGGRAPYATFGFAGFLGAEAGGAGGAVEAAAMAPVAPAKGS